MGAALLIRWAVLDAYAVPSGSMLPSLLIGDRMFVDKTAYGVRVPFTTTWLARWATPAQGDVVTLRDPEKPSQILVKRVVAVADDRLRWDERGLTLNQAPLAQRPLPEVDPWRAELPVELGRAESLYAAVAESLGDHVHRMRIGPDTGHTPGEVAVPTGSLFVLGDMPMNATSGVTALKPEVPRRWCRARGVP